jgi:hypothetical protein
MTKAPEHRTEGPEDAPKAPKQAPKPKSYTVRTRGAYGALRGAGFPDVSPEGVTMTESQKKAAEAVAKQYGVTLAVTEKED